MEKRHNAKNEWPKQKCDASNFAMIGKDGPPNEIGYPTPSRIGTVKGLMRRIRKIQMRMQLLPSSCSLLLGPAVYPVDQCMDDTARHPLVLNNETMNGRCSLSSKLFRC